MTSLSKAPEWQALCTLFSAFGIVRLIVPKVLIVQGEAPATASNIAAHETLIVSNLLSAAGWICSGHHWSFAPVHEYPLAKLSQNADRQIGDWGMCGLALSIVILVLLPAAALSQNTASADCQRGAASLVTNNDK
jgi:hypothetical protein